MTSDPYNRPLKRKRSGMTVALIVVAALILIGCAIGCIGVVTDDRAKDSGLDRLVTLPTPAPASAGKAQPATTKIKPIAPADVKLAVKITKKQCFGSAGCVVEFKVKVDVPVERLVGEDWKVTYEVKGVQDGPQIAELTLHPDGTFEQDAYQSGQTPSRSTKLTAKATDAEPVL